MIDDIVTAADFSVIPANNRITFVNIENKDSPLGSIPFIESAWQ
jgi:hypothetical protein